MITLKTPGAMAMLRPDRVAKRVEMLMPLIERELLAQWSPEHNYPVPVRVVKEARDVQLALFSELTRAGWCAAADEDLREDDFMVIMVWAEDNGKKD